MTWECVHCCAPLTGNLRAITTANTVSVLSLGCFDACTGHYVRDGAIPADDDDEHYFCHTCSEPVTTAQAASNRELLDVARYERPGRRLGATYRTEQAVVRKSERVREAWKQRPPIAAAIIRGLAAGFATHENGAITGGASDRPCPLTWLCSTSRPPPCQAEAPRSSHIARQSVGRKTGDHRRTQ